MKSLFSPSHKKVIFMDMNNTLVDRRRCFDLAFMATMDEFTARWEPNDYSWSSQDALQSYKLEWSRQRKITSQSALSQEELRKSCLGKALNPFPVNVNAAFSRYFFEQVEKLEDHHVSLFAGVQETLDQLASHYKLAIISNGSRSKLELSLTKLGLDKWITSDRLFSSRKDGIRKPQAGMFEAALHAMQIAPMHSVMVGNSWKNDVVGAAKCGMDAVWIHPAHFKKLSERRLDKQKVVIIRTFPQLAQIFLT
jgi:HAD superfamily hydrolase (TIGR01662 family)